MTCVVLSPPTPPHAVPRRYLMNHARDATGPGQPDTPFSHQTASKAQKLPPGAETGSRVTSFTSLALQNNHAFKVIAVEAIA